MAKYGKPAKCSKPAMLKGRQHDRCLACKLKCWCADDNYGAGFCKYAVKFQFEVCAIKYHFFPYIFLVSVVGYFAPFYLEIRPSSPVAYVYAFVGMVWVLLFSTMWAFSIVYPVWAYYKSKLNKKIIYSSVFTWLIYAAWLGFAVNGYVVTA